MLGRVHLVCASLVLLLLLLVPITYELPVARPIDPDLHWNPGESDGDAEISADEMEDAMALLEGGFDDPLFSDLPEPGSRRGKT